MRTRFLVLVFVGVPLLAMSPQSTDAKLAEALQQIRQGDFDAGVLALEPLLKQLDQQGAGSAERARGRFYLALAYLGLDQRDKARAQVLEAVRTDPKVKVSTREFPTFFVEFCREVNATAVETPSVASQQKRGSKLPLVLIGVGALGGGVALATRGSSSTPATPPTTLPARTTETITGAFVVARAPFPGPGGGASCTFDFTVGLPTPGTFRVSTTGATDIDATWSPVPVFVPLVVAMTDTTSNARTVTSRADGGRIGWQFSLAPGTYRLSVEPSPQQQGFWDFCVADPVIPRTTVQWRVMVSHP